ncbi:Gfo/Idh/MocA family protein [Microbacterium sp. NPDC058389]|uniref:Gfo/Idh/MocA family protein n=1 Tax=Microbacterium sp. NPDC058389 TaxID=3346475 RepID=UPI00364AA330
MREPMGVVVIGAGSISDEYLQALTSYPEIAVLGVADLDAERARAQADAHRVAHSGSTAEMLALPGVELAVNLTIPAVHAEVALEAIAAGKHVWGEKPFALDLASAHAVADAARARGVVLGNAPDTVLGRGIQNAHALLRAGRIGEPRSVLTLMQGPGPDGWHPRPEFLFRAGAGPLFDIGPYYITTLVTMFGSVERVQAVGNRAFDVRTIPYGPRQGDALPVEVPTHVSVLTTFRSGVLGTSVYSFDSPVRRQLFEVTGTEGVLTVPVSGYDGPSTIVPAHVAAPEVQEVTPPGPARSRGVGVLEMARAIRAGRAPRASGELALHVLEVMLAVTESMHTGESESVTSVVREVPPLPGTWSPLVPEEY